MDDTLEKEILLIALEECLAYAGVWEKVSLRKIRLHNEASLPKQKKNVDQEMHAS